MKKNLLKVMCLTAGVSTLGLTGCNFSFSVGKEIPITSFELGSKSEGKEEVKEEIEDKNSEELDISESVDSGFGTSEKVEEIEVKEEDSIPEETKVDDTEVEVKENINIETNVDMSQNNAIDISGVRQYDYFKAEMPSYLTYHGIASQDNNGMKMNMSIFTTDKETVLGIINMDLGSSGLNDYGIKINFSELSEDVMVEYLNNFGFSDMAPGEIKNEEYKKYNGLLYYVVDFEEDGRYGTISITIENNVMFMGMVTSDISIEDSRKVFEDAFNVVELNYQSVEFELDIECDSSSIFSNTTDVESDLTDIDTQELREPKSINSDIAKYDINGNQFIINQTTADEFTKMLGIEPEISDGLYNEFYYYQTEVSNLVHLSVDKESKVVKSVSIDYATYYNNAFQYDSIPWGSTLEDVKNLYGEPDYINDDSKLYGHYDWNLSDEITLSIMTEKSIDGMGNNVVISVEIDYFNY